MDLLTAILVNAERHPLKVCFRYVVGGEVRELTYKGLVERASTFAGLFSSRSVSAGQVVLLFLPTTIDAFPAFVGAMMLGAIPSFMPCPSKKQSPEIYWPSHQNLLQRIGNGLIVTDDFHAEQMVKYGLADHTPSIIRLSDASENIEAAKLIAKRSASDVAILQHSSGTTSLKKGVALSHRAIFAQAESYATALGISVDDNVATWLPVYHDMGFIACSIIPLILGQTVTVLDPFEWVARPLSLFDAIEKYNIHFAWLPNFAFEHLSRARVARHYDLSHLKALVNCSEAAKAETFDRFLAAYRRFGIKTGHLQVCYAMAETVFAVSQTTPGVPPARLLVDRDRLQKDGVVRRLPPNTPAAGNSGIELLSTGKPLQGLTVSIRNGTKEVAEGIVGEIVVKGGFVFDGYYNDGETTAQRLKNKAYYTRDLGFILEGELYVLGRKDDLLIINGRNLHAHEVEGILKDIPDIRPGRAVAIGIHNETIGSMELIVVAERRADSSSKDEAIASTAADVIYSRTNIEVKDVRIVPPEWLVKTTSGKISRELNKIKYLEELSATRPAAGASDSSATEAFTAIAKTISQVLGIASGTISRETNAKSVQGWDSLAHSTIMLAIEKDLGIQFADEELLAFSCVGEIVDRTEQLLGAHSRVMDRTVLDTGSTAIIRMGTEPGNFDIVIFAGAHKKFGGVGRMELSSVFEEIGATSQRKFYITDKAQSWYGREEEAIAGSINSISDRPKLLIGASMGGWGTLRYANLLANVARVLAFVPRRPPPRLDERLLQVRSNAQAEYCIMYGELEDENSKQIAAETFFAPNAVIMEVINCGHNLATYLHSISLLHSVLKAAIHSTSMSADIRRIVSSIGPDEKTKQRRMARNKPSGAVAEWYFL